LTRLKSTYADSLEKLVAADGRIHTTYNQAVAATGRLSSNDPNLQNIPIRTELGRGIRKAFHAAEGFTLASLDYSQIELRVLAHLCSEEALVHAFTTGEDVHTVTAQAMFGLGTDPATKEQRRLAKMLNYAVLYGVSEFGLAQQLGPAFGIKDARELIQQYNERFPSVLDFTKAIVADARAKGFTATLLGRRRYFPDIHAAKIQERRYAERQAMNAPIQGTAADMLKLAMIACADKLVGSESRMLLNVHDELVFEIADGEQEIIGTLRAAMESALPLHVPVEVDAKVGRDWNQMIPV
jgi:DNA polymerase-1